MSPLDGGFADPPLDAARVFRAAMQAMARPGRIYDITGTTPPAPLSVAAGALMQTLCDGKTPVFLAGDLQRPDVTKWITFHSGAPIVPAEDAAFAIGPWEALQPLSTYRIGQPDYPDRSATLIVEMPELNNNGATLTGPGIKAQHSLNLPDIAAFQDNAAGFPLGLDFYFTAGARLAALPRTTKVT